MLLAESLKVILTLILNNPERRQSDHDKSQK